MNISVQDELVESLAELRRMMPSMRLGQLIANMATVARGSARGGDVLLARVDFHFARHAARTSSSGYSGIVIPR